MMMKKFILMALSVLSVFFPILSQAEEKATYKDVYEMVLKAYEVVNSLGKDGLEAMNNPKGEFVFKDSYVYAMKCPNEIVAHPFALDKLKGKDLLPLYPFQKELCDAGKNPDGGWVEYQWPKPGETEPSRKIAFVLQVRGTPYTVAAGIYDDKASIADLNKTLK